jgi:hypothetical protein
VTPARLAFRMVLKAAHGAVSPLLHYEVFWHLTSHKPLPIINIVG